MRALHGQGGESHDRQADPFSPWSDVGSLPVSHLSLTDRVAALCPDAANGGLQTTIVPEADMAPP
jgi:hypothetical protein